jgi:DNA-binding response OmpR family regulator
MSTDRRSIIVVDDDQEINALVGAYVELCGFDYRPALTGCGALREVNADWPSLILLDLMLPDLDGYEVCTQLKSAATRDIPVVMLTALGGARDRERAQACGADDYLVKPFDPEQLMGVIKRYA